MCFSLKSDLRDSLHAEELEANGHDLANSLKQEDATGFFWCACDANGGIVLPNFDSDVIDKITNTVNLQVGNRQVNLLRQAQHCEGKLTLLRVTD